MGLMDKVKHKMEEARGKGKARTGGATGNRSMQARGTAEESKANMKQAGDKAKDAGDDVKDAFKSD